METSLMRKYIEVGRAGGKHYSKRFLNEVWCLGNTNNYIADKGQLKIICKGKPGQTYRKFSGLVHDNSPFRYDGVLDKADQNTVIGSWNFYHWQLRHYKSFIFLWFYSVLAIL